MQYNTGGPIRTYATADGSDIHHDSLLSNIAVSAFSKGVDGLVGNDLFPQVTVSKQSDRYAVIEKDAFLRIPETRRAPKTIANRVNFNVSSDRYFADNYALAGDNALEDLANADIAFQLRQNTVNLVMSGMLRDQERRVLNFVTSATNMGSGTILSGSDRWNNFVNSDPLGDVNTAHAFIRGQTGLIANTMVMDWDSIQTIRRHPDLLDMYKYVSGGQLDNSQLASVFNVDRILVSRAVKENALEGGTTSMTAMWGTSVLLAHIESPNGLETQTLGLRFTWAPTGFPAAMAVQTARESGPGKKNIEIVEAQMFQDERVIATDLGYLIDTAFD